MAPKKMKEHSNDLHELVIKHFLKGDTERKIAQKVLISRNTIYSIIAKYKSTKCVASMQGRGRKLRILIELFKEKSRWIVENLHCQ